SLHNLIKRPNIELDDFANSREEVQNLFLNFSKEVIEQATIDIKYKDYIEKEEQIAKKMASLEDYMITESLNYDAISAISAEAKEKLKKIRPETIGQASRISGVSPSDISILMIYLGK
ncbi:MAG: tRNA uridine-5-carboxymethylaminomethyl(34) synthesis enzyme MnmG, partial [Cytophagaceae bacterium]